MKILFTGGGTGGHTYPIIAVAEAINELVKEKKLLQPELHYIAPDPFDEAALFEAGIEFHRSPAGKIRRYASILNFFDVFKTALGIIRALVLLFSIYPDVIFSKGGYASFPTVFAGRLLRIPIFIHESDSTPGRVNRWAGTFAKRVAVSYPEVKKAFSRSDVVYTGHPVRKALYTTVAEGAREFLHLEGGVKTILVLGGSQGSEVINNIMLETLPKLIDLYQIVHQTGRKNIKTVEGTAAVVLSGNPHASRYHPFDYLNTLALRMSAGAASLVVTRGGSGTLFEIALWGIPAIIVPLREEVSHDQRQNAYAYARMGAGVVIEEENLTPSLLLSEINRILSDEVFQDTMKKSARTFARPDAARLIAEEIIRLALEHEVS